MLDRGERGILIRMASREYRLVVKGELSPHAARVFPGLTQSVEDGETVLVGEVRDQAELHGFLQRISDLGLELLSLTPVGGERNPSRVHVP
jgi:hypothetical protein